MPSALHRDVPGDASQSLVPERPWRHAQWWANGLLVLSVALVSARLVLQHAPACDLQIGAAEGALLALGLLLAGAVFNWASIDLLLSEVLPLGGHLSVTLSNLVSVVLMAGAIRAVSLALKARCWDIAGTLWLIVACACVGVYAASSVLGFCLTSRTWHLLAGI